MNSIEDLNGDKAFALSNDYMQKQWLVKYCIFQSQTHMGLNLCFATSGVCDPPEVKFIIVKP